MDILQKQTYFQGLIVITSFHEVLIMNLLKSIHKKTYFCTKFKNARKWQQIELLQ